MKVLLLTSSHIESATWVGCFKNGLVVSGRFCVSPVAWPDGDVIVSNQVGESAISRVDARGPCVGFSQLGCSTVVSSH